MNALSLASCFCLAAAPLGAQSFLELPATASPALELSSYSLVPFMQPNARVQMFFDAAEVGATDFVADQLAMRYDGPIPQVGAPGPFSITSLKIRVGTTTVAMPGSDFAANLTQPLTTVLDGPWSYMPDPGSAFPHPWGGPSNALVFPFSTPVPVSLPTGTWFVVDITMTGNNIALFGFSHAIVDGATTTGGVTNGSSVLYGTGCSAGPGQPAATMSTSGTYAPGAAHFLSGQNLGANALALTVFGLVDPAALLPGTSCTVNVDPIVYQLVITDGTGAFGPGQPGAALNLSPDGALNGLVVQEQVISLVPSANAFGLVTSNAAAVTLGSFDPLGRGTYTVAHDTDAAAPLANIQRAFGYAVRLRTL